MTTTADTSKATLKQKAGFAAIVAALSGFVGLLSALVALYYQVEPAVSAAIKRDFAPVGTVVASMLEPVAFAETIGEYEGDVVTKRRWILADGREVSGTVYARVTKGKPVPNLQGMFLRGIDLKNRREAGDLQHFATAKPIKDFVGATSVNGSHAHQGGMAYNSAGDRYNVGARDYVAAVASATAVAGDHSHQVTITGGGDLETRPDNIAVFYYIKIN